MLADLIYSPGQTIRVIFGLIINRFQGAGVWLEHKGGANQISGNFIGTNAAGTTGLGNGDGVKIVSGDNNLIGGERAQDRNVISGNANNGINISGDATNNNSVEGNYIGTDKDGAHALPNDVGVYLNDFTGGNVIGCEVINGDNVISGNTSAGIRIFESVFNLVEGNFIGTDKEGATPIANGVGVDITDARFNSVGLADFGNLISGNTNAGNTGAGVRIQSSPSSSFPTSNTSVQGNRIGTDRSGLVSVTNDVGILIRDASDSLIGVIGGGESGDGNLISGILRKEYA